ncbi:MAG: CPBP family intramembrane glutamic endopeptidase [Chloroflexota bacterium]|nr:CPBP family intramembrane glutamic endopeptidase [Chloroflexota bacterium]
MATDDLHIQSNHPTTVNARGKAVVITFAYLLSISFAELVTTLVDPLAGIMFHAVTLVLLLIHASLAEPQPEHKFLVSLSLVPLIRIISLATPLEAFSQTYWYVLTSIPLLIGSLVVIRTLNYNQHHVFLTTKALPIQLLVGTTGIGLGALEYYIFHPEPLVTSFSIERIILPALVLLVITAFTEELIFRGIIQQSAIAAFGDRGIFLVAAAFAALHISNLSAPEVALMFVVGIFFSWVVKRTGSLLGVTLCHGIASISLYLIIPSFA